MERDFDVRGICDGNTDLFIVVPPELLEEVRAWIRLWSPDPNAIVSEHIGAARKDRVIVLDEMPKLGYLTPVMNAWTMTAGAGVHFWAIIQSLSAREASLGPRNSERLVDNAERNERRDPASHRAPSGDPW